MSFTLHFVVLLNRVVILDNLLKQRVHAISSLFVMCGREEGLVQNLFFECNTTWNI